MRDLIVFASLVALGLTIRGVLRIPAHMTPSGLVVYLFSQAAFTSCSWIASQRFAYSETSYGKIYSLTAIAMLLAAASYCLRLIVSMRLEFLGLVALPVLCGLFLALRLKVGGHSFVSVMLQFESAAFVAFGLTTLATLAQLEGELSNRVRLFLGTFWILQGAFLYLYCAACAVERFHATAVLHSWFPSFVAFVAWTWLAMYLGGLHSELVKQNDAETEALETRWLSWKAQEFYRGAVHLLNSSERTK